MLSVFLQAVFSPRPKTLGAAHFEHLWRLVVDIASMHGRRSLQRLTAALDGRRTRQAIAHFFTQAEWDAPELLWHSARQTLTQLGSPEFRNNKNASAASCGRRP